MRRMEASNKGIVLSRWRLAAVLLEVELLPRTLVEHAVAGCDRWRQIADISGPIASPDVATLQAPSDAGNAPDVPSGASPLHPPIRSVGVLPGFRSCRRPLDCQTPRRSIGELRALSSLRARTDSQAAREASDDELRGVFAGPGGVAPVRPYVPDG